MAKTSLPNPGAGQTELLGAILANASEQKKYLINVDKNTVYSAKNQNEDRKLNVKKPIEELSKPGKTNLFGIQQTIGRVQLTSEQQERLQRAELDIKKAEDIKSPLIEAIKSVDFKGSAIKGVGNIIAKGLMPPLEKLNDAMNYGVGQITHGTATGVEQFNKGWAKMTDGLGELGPIINIIKTTVGKLRGAFDLVFGAIRTVYDFSKGTVEFFAKGISKVGGGLGLFKKDEDDAITAKGTVEELLKGEGAENASAMIDHKELRRTILAAMMDFDKISLDHDVKKEMFRSKFAKSSGFMEDDLFEGAEELHDEKMQNEKDQAKLSKKNEEKILKDRLKKERMFRLKQMMLSILSFIGPLGLLVGAIALWWKNFEKTSETRGLSGLTGSLSAIMTKLYNGFVKFGVLMSKIPLIGAPFKAAGFATELLKSSKTTTPTNVKPTNIYSGQGASNAVKTGINTGINAGARGAPVVAASTTRIAPISAVKALKLSGIMTAVGSGIEGIVDYKINKSNYNDLKEAHKNKLEFTQPDGSFRAITDEEMAKFDKIFNTSKKGSMGRTGGGFLGALPGIALMFTGVGFVPGMALAISGSMIGSARGEELMEGQKQGSSGLLGFGFFGGSEQQQDEFNMGNISSQIEAQEDHNAELIKSQNDQIQDLKTSSLNPGTISSQTNQSNISNMNSETFVNSGYSFTDAHMQYSDVVPT